MQVEGGALGGLMADLTGSLEHMMGNEPQAPAQTDNQSDKNTSKSGNISQYFGGYGASPAAPGQIPSTIPAPHMGDANVAQIQQDLTDMPLNYPRGQETLYPDKGGLKEGQETLKKEIKRGEQVGIIGIAIAFMLFLTQK